MLTLRTVCIAGLLAIPRALLASEPGPEPVRRFETKVRPLLAARCFQCHGSEKQRGGLRLDSAEGLAVGGETGPVVVPGDPGASPLIAAVRYVGDLKMPPKGKLSDLEVADLTTWVKEGAVWPGVTTLAKPAPTPDGSATPVAESWAFRPVRDVAPPAVKGTGWTSSAIDLFILALLEKKGLKPATEADKRTLIRRAAFDLSGLPPTPEDVDAFLADDSPEAFTRVVDRLLSSPRYGERWGRHWLDLARYSDSNGMDENVAYATAFRYRDYVVRAFNADTPYDRFVKEQLAGDLLPRAAESAVNHDRVTATGFLVLGPKMLAEDDPVKMEMDIIDEQVDTVGRVFMGLTIGCARCHDHKFDPIPTKDYYSLAGIFKSTKSMQNHKVVAMWNERPLATKAQAAALETHTREAAKRTETITSLADRSRMKVLSELRDRLADYLLAGSLEREAEPTTPDALARIADGLNPRLVEHWRDELKLAKADRGSLFHAWHNPSAADASVRSALERDPAPANRGELARRYQSLFEEAAKADTKAQADRPVLAAFRLVLDDPTGPFAVKKKAERLFPPATAAELKALRDALAEFEKQAPPVSLVMGVEDQAATNLKVHIRGNHLTLGEAAPRRFLKALAGDAQPPIPDGRSGRLELAEWLTRDDHPLTARVMANRIWLGHFGEGLVRSPDNFGRLGDRPVHTDLLDWLAGAFVRSGWSVKAMHRLVMLSSTYRMSTTYDAAADLADPENRLHWRMKRRRLEAEAVRDAILAVSGELDATMGGTLLKTKTHAYVNSTGPAGKVNYDVNRRSIYLPVIRSGLYDVFQAFDFADPSTSNGQRTPTTVAPQALFMMNDRLVLRCSEALARRLLDRAALDDPGRFRQAYRVALGREPTAEEVRRVSTYLARFDDALKAEGVGADARRMRAWQGFCQALIASSEFVFID